MPSQSTRRKEDMTEQYTAEALEMLQTRKALPTKFKDQLTEKNLKFCTECRTVKSLEQFRFSATSKSGRAGKCFTCHPEQVKISERDFSIDPEEYTLPRSLAALRRKCRKNGYPVDHFGAAELMAHWDNPPRSEVPEVTLINPERGFKLENLLPLITNKENNENE